MKRCYITYVILMVLLSLLIVASISASDLRAYNLGIKEMSRHVTIAVFFSMKADVINDNIPGIVFVRIQGIDSDGFEVGSFLLRGEFKSNERRTLTRSTSMDTQQYDSVVKWLIVTIDKRLDK